MEVLDLFEKKISINSLNIEHKEFDIIVGGGGFRCYYHLGFFKLLKLIPNIMPRHFIGTSSGAISIVYHVCELTDQQIFKTYELIQRQMSLGSCLHDAAVQALREILPSNAHELCNGKIKIFVSEFTLFGFSKKYIDHFETFDDLILSISASINIPCLTSSNIYGTIINGSRCYDGCFASLVPIFCPRIHDLNQLVLLTHKVTYPKRFTLYPGDPHIYLLALKGLIEAKDFFTKKDEHSIIKWIDKTKYKTKSKPKYRLVIIPGIMYLYSLFFV
jgi:hypothetical protein